MDQSPAAAAQRLAFNKRALISAVRTGDTETVVDLLDRGIPIDTKDDKGLSLLHWAAVGGQVTTMRLLIRRGCGVDSVDGRGLTPLHWAAAMGRTKAVRELIRKGASKSVVVGNCGTPLHQAVGNGYVKTAVAMLEEGCPLDVVSGAGATVLHAASKGGNVELVRELVSRGCDVNAVAANGCTPLHSAAGCGGTEAVCELIKLGATKSLVAGNFGTPLHQAAYGGHVETAVAMLKEGCPLDVVSGAGATVLHLAAIGGNVDLVRELVSRECDVNAVKANGCTPLHDAAVSGRTGTVRELIKLGATKSVVGGRYGTPLHQAIIRGHVETVGALLEDELSEHDLTSHDVIPSKTQVLDSGIIGTCDSFGRTPVMWALRCGQVKVLKLLISKGAGISDRDQCLLCAFEHCFVGGHASKLSQFCEASGIRSSGERLKGVLTTLISQGLADAHKVLCLCAVSGDCVFLDDHFSELVASDACAVPAAVNCVRYCFQEGASFIDQLKIPDEHALNPLQMALLSLKCYQMGFAIKSVRSGTKDHTLFITKLLSHPVLKKTVHENFPNGLSPLDLARQFELHHIATLIEEVGGRPGVWAGVPQEIKVKHPLALHRVKEAYASIKAIAEDGEHGRAFIRHLLSSVPHEPLSDSPPLHGAEQSSEDGVLRQKPTLSRLVRLIMTHVSTQNWRLVGLLLLEDIVDAEDTLNAISHQCTDDLNRFLETLSYWLEHGSSVTWKTLLDVLGHFETKHTVDELTDKIVSVLGGGDQVVAVDGSFRPVSSSAPVVSGGAVAAERSPLVCEATMRPWNKAALKAMRKELGRVNMGVVMIKQLEKSDVPNPNDMGFLSHEQLQVVESKTTPAEQMNMVIDYLLEMEDKYFENFCTILEQNNFEGKAKLLREKAKDLEKIVGELSLRKGSTECALQDQSPAKRIVRCALTGSEETVEALGVSRSAPVVSGGVVAAERSPPNRLQTVESEVQTDGWEGKEQNGLWHPKAVIVGANVGPETDEHEYKSLMVPADKTKKPPSMRPCKDTSEVLKKVVDHSKEINAMLNHRTGGSIHFGIHDDGIVEEGLDLPQAAVNDKLQTRVGQLLQEFYPAVQSRFVAIQLVNLANRSEEPTGRWRFDICVTPHHSEVVLISNKDTVAYYRQGGNSEKMTANMMEQLRVERQQK